MKAIGIGISPIFTQKPIEIPIEEETNNKGCLFILKRAFSAILKSFTYKLIGFLFKLIRILLRLLERLE